MSENFFSAYRRSRVLIIIEAAVEYFISICVTTTFLNAILNEMQVAASLQGIIGAITSLACSVQLLAVFGVRKTYPCKRWVCVLNLINQLLFALLYCVPQIQVSQGIRVAIFIFLLLIAYSCQHYLTPSRVSWHMALVEDNKRGVFTANKEIVSLISGMIFSQCAGILLDHFRAKGNMKACFFIFAATVSVLSLSHFFLMISIREAKPAVDLPPKKMGDILHILFGNAPLRRVMVFDALFEISQVSLFFYPVYLTQTFGFSYTYITFVAILHACFRALISRFLGRMADKKSWCYMLRVCMTVLSVGYVIFALATPKNAQVLYPLFSLCHAFSLGGSNSAKTNLCFDYVSRENRRYILGTKAAISGIVGFLTTLLASSFVNFIENHQNKLFGIPVYPQQLLFTCSAALTMVLALLFLPRFSSSPRNKKPPLRTNKKGV